MVKMRSRRHPALEAVRIQELETELIAVGRLQQSIELAPDSTTLGANGNVLAAVGAYGRRGGRPSFQYFHRAEQHGT